MTETILIVGATGKLGEPVSNTTPKPPTQPKPIPYSALPPPRSGNGAWRSARINHMLKRGKE